MILNVPYYSQLKDTQKAEWKYESCGITCLKMILDFYGKDADSIDGLFQKGLDIGGYKEDVGWYHHSLGLLAKQYGCTAIPRSWTLTEAEIQKFEDQGFNNTDTALLIELLTNEGIESLKQEIKTGHPLIVSVPKNFEINGSGHLMAVTGYDKNKLILNDPFDEIRNGKSVKITIKEFKKVWTGRAIYIHP